MILADLVLRFFLILALIIRRNANTHLFIISGEMLPNELFLNTEMLLRKRFHGSWKDPRKPETIFGSGKLCCALQRLQAPRAFMRVCDDGGSGQRSRNDQ